MHAAPPASLPSLSRHASPWPRRAAWGAFGVLASVGLVGALHLPFAAPLLRAISPAGLCPVTRGTPAQIDRARAIGAAAIRAEATADAPARPALGFPLDARFDVAEWARTHGVQCAAIGGNANLQRCNDVPAAAIPAPSSQEPIEELDLELRATGELANVQTMRRGLAADRAATLVSSLESGLGSALGAPSKVAGVADAAHFADRPLATYVAEHAFRDFRATVSATSFGARGTMVREQYVSTR